MDLFTVLKRIGSSAYRLALPDGVEIHPVFQVSHLKVLLGSSDNTVATETLVTSEELSSKPHVPKRILDVKTKNLHTKVIQEFKIKWIDNLSKIPHGNAKILLEQTSLTFHSKSAMF